ncbi:MAG TPA: S66 peptidase family protein [Longimicrobiaceae bacterium]|nr:S66 peptidase family protein [Longimicrobiaceae bacterium]
MRHPLIRPPALEPGDTIGIFTPSSPAHVRFREKYLHGISQLEALGFRVVEGPLTAAQTHQGYRSGSPEERAAEFMALILDPEIKALISTIGGDNSASMIPYLDFAAIRAHPKVICGYSDVTSLHLAILAYSGLSTFYGPAVMPSSGEWPEMLSGTRDSFLDAVHRHRSGSRRLQPPLRWSDQFRDAGASAWKEEPRRFEPNPGWRALAPGQASAAVVVANLATLCRNAGTPHFPELAGTILLVEEMDAPLAREEAGLRQLQLMGVFDELAGLIIGKPESFSAQGASFGYDDLVLEIVGERPYPIVSNFDCGHTHPMLTLAQMTRISLTTTDAHEVSVTVEEPMVVAQR